MRRNSTIQVLKNRITTSNWRQPPYILQEVPIDRRQEFLRTHSNWYKVNHPEWLQQQSSQIEIKPSNHYDFRNSTNQTPKQIVEKARELVLKNSEGYYIRQEKLQRAHYTTIGLYTSVTVIFELAIIISIIEVFQRFYHQQDKKLIQIYQQYNLIIVLTIIKSFQQVVIIRNSNNFNHIIIESLEMNLIIILLNIFAIVGLIHEIQQRILNTNNVQSFILAISSIIYTMTYLIKPSPLKPPQINKIAAFNFLYFNTACYALRQFYNHIFKMVLQSIKRILPFSVLHYVFLFLYYNQIQLCHSTQQMNAKDALLQVFPVLIFNLAIDLVMNTHISFISRKIEKYTLLNDNNLQTLIMANSYLEIETLKYLYYNLEQPKKLCFEDNNENTNILRAYQSDRIEGQINTIEKLAKEQDGYITQLKRVQNVGAGTDLSSIWKGYELRKQINFCTDRIEREVKLLAFLNGVMYKMLEYNTLKLSEADQTYEANQFLKIHMEFLKSTKGYRLKCIREICYNLLALCRSFNVPNRSTEIQSYLDK